MNNLSKICKGKHGCFCIKLLSEFSAEKRNKDGLQNTCTNCIKTFQRKYNIENKEKLSISKKIYKENHKKQKSIQAKVYRQQNKEKIAKRDKIYYEANKEKIIKQGNEYRIRNREKNREKVNAYARKVRGTTNGKLTHFCRKSLSRILEVIKQDKKISSISNLNYNIIELKEHIENQFDIMMTWGNHGKWHIDHKESIASLLKIHKDKSQREILNTVNALDNLQPLWEVDNLRKGK